MSVKIKIKKQYKPIKFGDGPDPDTIEGHHNRMAEAAETRRYNRRMKELAAENELKCESLLSNLLFPQRSMHAVPHRQAQF